jgi:hypothetical protein
MQLIAPPPAIRRHWGYDDPSGVPEPAAYAQPWRRRDPLRTPRVVTRRAARLTHREA